MRMVGWFLCELDSAKAPSTPLHYPHLLHLNSSVSNADGSGSRARRRKLREERHVYSHVVQQGQPSSVGAAYSGADQAASAPVVQAHQFHATPTGMALS